MSEYIYIYIYIPDTVKGQSRSDSLLLSPYHWAKLFRGGRSDCGCALWDFCDDLLSRFRGCVGKIHVYTVFPLGSWMTTRNIICWSCLAYLAYMGETSPWSFLLHTSFGWDGGSSSLLDCLGWRRGAVAQGVTHFILWSMMALGPAFHSSWVYKGWFGGSFGGH